MKRLMSLSFVISCVTLAASSQRPGGHLSVSSAEAQHWTLRQCMQYAVEHNHEVKRAELELDNYKAGRTGAVGRFLPAATVGIGAQYNFGRAIDPETNIYTDVSTFNNGYQLQASLPIFDGFGRIHALRAAKAGVLMGLNALRQQQSQTALSVLQAYANAVYYEGLVRMAQEKVGEMTLLLRQTRLLEEVGRKSLADVAQVESQKAEADYELTRQQNLYASALLELKTAMGYPLSESLTPDPSRWGEGSNYTAAEESRDEVSTPLPPAGGAGGGAVGAGEEAVARYQMEVAKHEWRQAHAALYPSLSLSAGLNTTYFHTLHSDAGQAFHTQFKNNMGEYVGATLSIPLFNRLQSVMSIRRAKNNYRIACENYEQKKLELEKLSREAWHDWQGYQEQTRQMKEKVEADSIAYLLTRRQFDEGLSTAIDLRTTSAQLLNSKATLLQCRLMAIVKEHLVRYYHGEQIWE